MLVIALLAGGVLFTYLAVDAWRLRSNHTLPYSLLAKLRGYPPQVHTVQRIEQANLMENRFGAGNTSFAFLPLAVVAVGFFASAGVVYFGA